jgi:hypothetical protein
VPDNWQGGRIWVSTPVSVSVGWPLTYRIQRAAVTAILALILAQILVLMEVAPVDWSAILGT